MDVSCIIYQKNYLIRQEIRQECQLAPYTNINSKLIAISLLLHYCSEVQTNLPMIQYNALKEHDKINPHGNQGISINSGRTKKKIQNLRICYQFFNNKPVVSIVTMYSKPMHILLLLSNY